MAYVDSDLARVACGRALAVNDRQSASRLYAAGMRSLPQFQVYTGLASVWRSASVQRVSRRLRLQFPNARYHIINRGNFRHPIFSSAGAGQAFERTLDEAARRFRWLVHAYVVMSNHYHLALETPEPNLATGMHWLQTTFAVRHNRFRRRHGHLSQGRFKSLLIQDTAHLVRVIDYIHLNPVRAGIVPADRLLEYRAISLVCFAQGNAAPWLVAKELLEVAGLAGSPLMWPAA